MDIRVLVTRGFVRLAGKLGLTDQALLRATEEIEAGLVDARLGGFLLKKRIAVDGRGKSGGLRTILAYRKADRVVFMYVFGKNERDNISERERVALSELGDEYMGLTPSALDSLVEGGQLREVCDGNEGEGGKRHTGRSA